MHTTSKQTQLKSRLLRLWKKLKCLQILSNQDILARFVQKLYAYETKLWICICIVYKYISSSIKWDSRKKENIKVSSQGLVPACVSSAVKAKSPPFDQIFLRWSMDKVVQICDTLIPTVLEYLPENWVVCNSQLPSFISIYDINYFSQSNAFEVLRKE